MANDSHKTLAHARGLDYHGADPVSHRFTIADVDGRE
jgi:hypothetical protein